MRKLLFIILLSLTTVAFGQNDFQSRKSLLSRDSILIGDQIEWVFPLEFSEGENFFLEEPEDPVVQGVETISKLSFDTLSAKKGLVKVEGKIILTSFDSGSYYLPNLLALIERENGQVDTILFDGPVLEVNTIPIDTSNYVIKEIKDQMKYPVTFREVALWVLLVLLIAAVIYVIVRYIKYRKENKTFFGKPVVKDPPHIVALRSLDKIHKQKLWQNSKQKQFYTAVTDTLRVYIADRFGIVALERPSGEMLEDLKKENIDAGIYEEVSELFARADLVKFAKYEAGAEENENTIPVAVRFVNASYQQEIEEE
ncbi:MAG: hypothetical protein IJS02_01825 [Bacteroidales bacterium]|nr:hypothetical protein [Bacteroidales bacterium]